MDDANFRLASTDSKKSDKVLRDRLPYQPPLVTVLDYSLVTQGGINSPTESNDGYFS